MKLEKDNNLNALYSNLQSTVTAILKHEECPQFLYERLSDFVLDAYNNCDGQRQTLIIAANLRASLTNLKQAA